MAKRRAKKAELEATVVQPELLDLERRRQAVELRILGSSYVDIARELGVSAQTAFQIVSNALDDARKEMREKAKDLRDLESDRLDTLYRKVAGAVMPEDAPVDPRLIETALKIMERRAKLLGLDAPTKVAGTGPGGSIPVGLFLLNGPPQSDEDARAFLQHQLGDSF